MSEAIRGKHVAFLATDGVEQVELGAPWAAVEDAGGVPELISIHPGEIQGVNGMDKGETFQVSRTVEEAAAVAYDGLVLPGGVANPDKLRMDPSAVAFVRAFMDAGKPVAAICHGPWLLVEAGVLRDRVVTSYPSLQTDIRNAGGAWVDREVHVDHGLVTSRNPGDLPAFCSKLLEEIGEGSHPDVTPAV